MSRWLALLSLFIAVPHITHAQSEYVFKVELKDKVGTGHTISDPSTYLSPRAIQNRSRQNINIDSLDLPVSQVYIDQILSISGATLHGTSRWLNAAYFVATDSTFVTASDTLPYVLSISQIAYYPSGYGEVLPLDTHIHTPDPYVSDKRYDYGYGGGPITLHNASPLHLHDFTGSGSLIAVLDDGFQGVDIHKAFDHLFVDQKIVATKNFVRPSMDVYTERHHGTRMLSVMAALESGRLIGTAPQASYTLLVTEDGRSEQLIELENWVMGLEFADSLGADIASSSLGYNTFDDADDNFTIAQLDGKSCTASIAATIAARKGMIIVTSAGNEAGGPWGHILFPSDADSILTVGGVNKNGNWAGQSAPGPTADGRIKPDVVSLGAGVFTISATNTLLQETGTSLSVPIISGLTACLIQTDRSMTAQEYVQMIRTYSSLYANPQNKRGYGIPNFGLMHDIMSSSRPFIVDSEVSLYPNPTTGHFSVEHQTRQKWKHYYILDATGAIVKSAPLSGQHTLHLTAPHTPGYYTLLLTTDRGVIIRSLQRL